MMYRPRAEAHAEPTRHKVPAAGVDLNNLQR
jgi:hypothetical protein